MVLCFKSYLPYSSYFDLGISVVFYVLRQRGGRNRILLLAGSIVIMQAGKLLRICHGAWIEFFWRGFCNLLLIPICNYGWKMLARVCVSGGSHGLMCK
jgi:hypothetical protein